MCSDDKFIVNVWKEYHVYSVFVICESESMCLFGFFFFPVQRWVCGLGLEPTRDSVKFCLYFNFWYVLLFASIERVLSMV